MVAFPLPKKIKNKNVQKIHKASQYFLFVWVDFVSSDVKCYFLKPVHSVIDESHQT